MEVVIFDEDEDYEEQSEANLGNKEVQFQQLENNVHLVHFSYKDEEESAENFESSEGTLPFCFASFQFIRDNYHTIRKQISTSLGTNCLEGNQIFAQNLSYLDLQPQSAIECQVPEEDLEAGTYDQINPSYEIQIKMITVLQDRHYSQQKYHHKEQLKTCKVVNMKVTFPFHGR